MTEFLITVSQPIQFKIKFLVKAVGHWFRTPDSLIPHFVTVEKKDVINLSYPGSPHPGSPPLRLRN